MHYSEPRKKQALRVPRFVIRYSGTIGDGFVKIDRFVAFTAAEEVRDELLNFSDTDWDAEKDDDIDCRLVHL